MLKPIETAYKGYRMRSRLEARWAVFFDRLGLHWRYEAEGYDLDGLWYLPDFWIDDWSAWVEIKPVSPSNEERQKCQLLAATQTGRVLMIAGDPWPTEYKVIEWVHHSYELADGIEETKYRAFADCRRCKGFALMSEEATTWLGSGHTERCYDRWPLQISERLDAAFVAAREIRFGR